MRYVGKIDREVYSCVARDIVTDEVIITDERVQHIIERRGKAFYDAYSPAFADILADPDYIFGDSRPNTALACKTFSRDRTAVNLVVRFAVVSDGPQYKNSIITAIKENEKRFAQRIRNNVPLYKKE